MIIDCHGRYTTEFTALGDYRKRQVAASVEGCALAPDFNGKGIDPDPGFNYDGTKRYIDAVDCVNAAQREKIYSGNALRVYPRLGRQLSNLQQ